MTYEQHLALLTDGATRLEITVAEYRESYDYAAGMREFWKAQRNGYNPSPRN